MILETAQSTPTAKSPTYLQKISDLDRMLFDEDWVHSEEIRWHNYPSRRNKFLILSNNLTYQGLRSLGGFFLQDIADFQADVVAQLNFRVSEAAVKAAQSQQEGYSF